MTPLWFSAPDDCRAVIPPTVHCKLFTIRFVFSSLNRGPCGYHR